MKPALLIPLAALALSGCSHKVFVSTPVFSPDDHAAYMRDDKAGFLGESAYVDADGRTVSCSGHRVYLLPDTPFFQELLTIDNSGYYLRHPIDPRAQHLIRSATCSAQGTFVFENLPEAKWVAVSPVSWKYDDEASYKPHHVTMVKEVRSRAQHADEIFIVESDASFEVPDYALERLNEHRIGSDLHVKGGECNVEKLGKEDVLPAYCEDPKPIKHKKHRKQQDWRVEGEK